MSDRPKHNDGLEINPVADGYIVYQPKEDRVHYLNHSAAVVLELCNGENSRDDILQIMQMAYDLPESPDELVNECLDKFTGEGLIT
jgi:hypothetical protein